jgi:eukaryotic-like serine/threonine-protein kinase
MNVARDSGWFASGYAIGAYRVVEPLGDGGMGMVYVAEHTLIGKRVAVKVLRGEYGATPQLVERFFNEARVTTAIRHPGIVEVFDFGYTDTAQPYIVMELLEGQSLAARLADGEKVKVLEALAIARGIASALSAAHARAIVHRDLKPDNVFLVREADGDRVKLLDFGIAKLGCDPTVSRTRTGLLLGTPQYMSPEQCRGASACDHRSDLYSLGCVLFEMLAGSAPFTGDLTELLNGHLYTPPPALDAPPMISALVASLLAKDVEQRPASAAVVVRELDRLADCERARSIVALPAPRRRFRAPIAVALCVALGIAGVGLVRHRAVAAPPAVDAPTLVMRTIDASPPDVAVRATALDEAPVDAPVDAPRRRTRPDAMPAAASNEDVSSDLEKPHEGGVDTPVP